MTYDEGGPSESGSLVAIFSDIHGNKAALQSVLAAIEQTDADPVYCCGDIVGYGPYPNECCEILRERGIPTIAGNHDHAALGLTDTTYFNEIAKRAIEWTRKQLSEENIEYLSGLPMSLIDDECLYVHASPVTPEAWSYVLTMGDARACFDAFDQKFCFIGHSHQPFIIENRDGSLACPSAPRSPVKDDARYLVNVGSVGQPRDRNPAAAFCLYNRAEGTLEIRRAEYDISETARGIQEIGLPEELGERLLHGW